MKVKSCGKWEERDEATEEEWEVASRAAQTKKMRFSSVRERKTERLRRQDAVKLKFMKAFECRRERG